jgi:hypothetical protein
MRKAKNTPTPSMVPRASRGFFGESWRCAQEKAKT